MSSTLRERTLKNGEPWIISIGIATSSPSEAFQGVWAKPFRAWSYLAISVIEAAHPLHGRSHRSARWTTVKQFEEEGGAEDEDQNEDKDEDEWKDEDEDKDECKDEDEDEDECKDGDMNWLMMKVAFFRNMAATIVLQFYCDGSVSKVWLCRWNLFQDL